MADNKRKQYVKAARPYVITKKSKTGTLLLIPATKLTIKSASAKSQRSGTSVMLIPQGRSLKKKQNSKQQPPAMLAAPEAQEPASFNTSLPPTQSQRDHEHRKRQEVKLWETLRPIMLQTSVEQHARGTTTCAHCKHPDCAEYRCQDCLPMVLCKECIVSLHVLTRLHIIEQWMPEIGTFCEVNLPELKILSVPEIFPSPLTVEKPDMTLVDDKGRTHHNCTIVYGDLSPHSLSMALLKLGFWPSSPANPNVAVSTRLLSLLNCLTLESHTSCAAFIAAIDKTNSNHGYNVKSKLKSISRGECLPEFRLFWSGLKTAPLSLKTDLHTWISICPACPKSDESVGPIVSMDANFGLVHKRNSGKTYNTYSPFNGRFFLPQDDVDEFVGNYYQDQKDDTEQCSQFQAADAIRSKNKTPNLTVTGVFGCACRHEIPLVFMDVRHGERLAYSVLTLKDLKAKHQNIRAMYDIACVLNNHLKKRKNSDLLQGVQLSIPSFHSYGHKGICQVTMNPRRMAGFGLSDGEQMERLWSYLRPFSKITKEQTPGHRKELLVMALQNWLEKKVDNIDVSLLQKLTKAREGKSTAKATLEKELSSINAAVDDKSFIEQLVHEEKLQFKTAASRFSLSLGSNWRRAYANELLRFYTLQSQLNSGIISADDTDKVLQTTRAIQLSSKKLEIFERKQKIQRWRETSHDYMEELKLIDDVRRKGLLVKLQSLAAEKQFFHDMQRRHGADGQTISNRLRNQLKTNSSRISTTVNAYNIGANSSHESIYPAAIQQNQVSVGSDIFNTLEEEGYTSQIPSQVRRKLIDQFNLVSRCEEEEGLVLSEMGHTYSHFSKLYAHVSEMIDTLERTTLYEAGLYSVSAQFLGRLQVHLQGMYRSFHPHINILPPPDTRLELFYNMRNGEDGAQESNEDEPEEDEAECDDPTSDLGYSDDTDEGFGESSLSGSYEIIYG